MSTILFLLCHYGVKWVDGIAPLGPFLLQTIAHITHVVPTPRESPRTGACSHTVLHCWGLFLLLPYWTQSCRGWGFIPVEARGGGCKQRCSAGGLEGKQVLIQCQIAWRGADLESEWMLRELVLSINLVKKPKTTHSVCWICLGFPPCWWSLMLKPFVCFMPLLISLLPC